MDRDHLHDVDDLVPGQLSHPPYKEMILSFPSCKVPGLLWTLNRVKARVKARGDDLDLVQGIEPNHFR